MPEPVLTFESLQDDSESTEIRDAGKNQAGSHEEDDPIESFVK